MSTASSSSAEPAIAAGVALVGDELLSGQTRDLNLPWIARFLNEIGVQTTAAEIVADRCSDIGAAVGRLRNRCRYVIVTGGIGPTHDDVTAEAIARFFGVDLRIDAEARRRLERHYGSTEISPARLRMARIPQGARLIDNPVSGAPGFEIENVFVLAGVPTIMQAMLTSAAGRFRGGRKLGVTGVYVEMGESHFSQALQTLQESHPEASLGSYPVYRRDGTFAVRLIARDRDPERLAVIGEKLVALVEAEGATPKILAPDDIVSSSD